ncbi:MAG: hypothetical protein ACYTHJ_19810 [Planctomycetota bacterium]
MLVPQVVRDPGVGKLPAAEVGLKICEVEQVAVAISVDVTGAWAGIQLVASVLQSWI